MACCHHSIVAIRSFIYKFRMFASLACKYANRLRLDWLISTFGEKMPFFVELTVHLTKHLTLERYREGGREERERETERDREI